MTAPTTKQMLALADEWQQQLHDAAMTQSEKDKRERTVAALRAAANQLEAVQFALENSDVLMRIIMRYDGTSLSMGDALEGMRGFLNASPDERMQF